MRNFLLSFSVLVVTAGCGGDKSPTSPRTIAPPRALWTVTGSGNDVLTKPLAATRLAIAGAFSGRSANFIVWCGTGLLVNELLGTSWGPLTYSGTHATPSCTEVRIENSTGVSWTLTEVR